MQRVGVLYESLLVLLRKWIGVVLVFGVAHRSVLRVVTRIVAQGDRVFFGVGRTNGVSHETLLVLSPKGIGVVSVVGLTHWSIL